MAKTKYGIKVPLAVDDYIWVTEDRGSYNFDPRPVLYNTRNEAVRAAEIWGPMAEIKPYPVDNN